MIHHLNVSIADDQVKRWNGLWSCHFSSSNYKVDLHYTRILEKFVAVRNTKSAERFVCLGDQLTLVGELHTINWISNVYHYLASSDATTTCP